MKFNTDPAFLKKRAEAYKQKRDNPNSGSNRDFIFTEMVQVYKVRDGQNIIRTCPNPNPDAVYFYEEIFLHYNIGANGGQYLCLARMKNMPCPICEEWKAAKEAGRPDKEVSALNAQQRAVAYLIDRLDSDVSKQPQIWSMPNNKVAGQILNISFKPATGETLFFDDPAHGYDVYFIKTGKDLATVYGGFQKDESTPLHKDKATMNKWLDHIEAHPIHKMLNFKSYEYLHAVLNGEDPNINKNVTLTSETTAVAKTVTKVETKTEASSSVEDLTLTTLSAMTRDQLLVLIEDKKLELDPEEWTDTEQLAQAIALSLDIAS